MDAAALKILEQLGLVHRADYYPENLSGGQKQRVTVASHLRFAQTARALITQPKIILADEPTAALDKQSGQEVITLMEKLAEEQHCTILLVTHDSRILDRVAHQANQFRAIYMEDGQFVNKRQEVAA